MAVRDNLLKSFRSGTSLTRLIYINVAVFIIISVVSIIAFLLNNQIIPVKVIDLLSVPASLSALLVRPWTIITYMFTHKDIWHILFNMLWLYWFGRIFLEYLDQRKLVAVYLLGGICGAIVYVLSFNIFPVYQGIINESVAIGASASVMAIVIAIAAYVPNYTINLLFIGRIRIIYVALVIFILTSAVDFSVNSGGKLAHIGGALFGYLFTLNIKKGRDIGRGINRIIDFFATLFKPRKKMKVTYKKPATDYDYNKLKTERQARINQILDKISKGGYDSLTKEEKEILFKESQQKN
jgi:membrane associated rhomboid family serine protease